MFSLFRYQRNGLPHGLITNHEFVVRDIFRYFEKSRFVRKKTRNARKAINAALRFARKKKTYPSKKTAEALDALGQMQDELEYTHKVILTAFEEAEKIINLIKQEKVGEIIPLVEKARDRFKNHDLEGGMERLKEAQENLNNKFLLKSRKATLGGLDSDIKKLKHELMGREKR
jgi:sulfatase maturation enzyme AslB (radical SAM superfamily)